MNARDLLQSSGSSAREGTDPLPAAEFPGPHAGEPDRPLGVLLVDDHRENLAALEAVLEPLGERLITAESGEQALRALLREEIAVILLDVRMAGLDGLQTARIIRERPRTRHIPIIFLTAQASDVEDIALAYATGAVDYVVKPYEPEILRAKVSVFIELSRERAERVRQSEARAEAEAVARTVRTLQILSDAALAHQELDGLAAELLDRSATLFQADGATLLLRDDNAPRLNVHASHGRIPPWPAAGVTLGEGTLGQLALERRPALVRTSDLRPLAEAAEQHASPIESLLIVPLVAANHLLGLLALGASAADRFDSGDLELLTLAADRIALAVDHVTRYAQGRQLVETLQRSLLPDRLAQHPQLELAARYLPSGMAPQIGGDWYDAVALDADRTAIMLGDVVGHGVRAATTMSELRNALRAFAVEGHSPGAALQQLNRVVRVTFGPRMLATAVFVIIDMANHVMTIAVAGHPPPALRNAEGRVRFLEGDQSPPPLGVDDHLTPSETQLTIGPGDTLLLFTDGLVERRGESIDLGFERLVDAFANAPLNVGEICEHVLAQAVDEQASHDDVAILAVRVLGRRAGPLELTLPAKAPSVPLARHRLRDWLNAEIPELDPMVRGELELAWTEACTNAIRHAYGPSNASFDAAASLESGEVCLQIRDHGSWRPPRERHGGRGLQLMRELCDEVLIDRRAEGTTVTMRRSRHRSVE